MLELSGKIMGSGGVLLLISLVLSVIAVEGQSEHAKRAATFFFIVGGTSLVVGIFMHIWGGGL